MALLVLHSPHERCGIAEYGRALGVAFLAEGVTPRSRPLSASPEFILNDVAPGTVVLVHFEPSLVPFDIASTLMAARERGARVVFCCHWFGDSTLANFGHVADRFVVHRDYGLKDQRVVEIPLGCPVYDPPADKASLRRRYELPEDAIVVTTLGFLSPWKKLPAVAGAMARMMRMAPRVFLQVLTAIPFAGDAHGEKRAMQRVLSSLPGDRYFFSTEFRVEQDLLDRLAASDLAFLYHGQDTGSVSAATKACVAARLPAVVTGSSHASDIREGVHRVEGFDPARFSSEVLFTAGDPPKLAAMREGMEREYRRLNMRAVARRYIDLFGSLA